jgi:hypothetical protein
VACTASVARDQETASVRMSAHMTGFGGDTGRPRRGRRDQHQAATLLRVARRQRLPPVAGV